MKQPVDVIKECAEELRKFKAQRKANDAFVDNKLEDLAERLELAAKMLDHDGELDPFTEARIFANVISVIKAISHIVNLMDLLR